MVTSTMWRSALALLLSAAGAVGCSPGDPVIVDSGPDAIALDVIVLADAPPDSAPISDAPRPDAPVDDAPVEDDAGPVTCGWSDTEGTFVCSGADAMPAGATCTGTRCCAGTCEPGGGEEVCCDPTSGTIEIYRYSAGACPLDVANTCA